jgi:peptide/nickel transport system ATP-binding protein
MFKRKFVFGSSMLQQPTVKINTFDVMSKPLLSINNLEISFKKGVIKLLSKKTSSYDLQENEILGIVGGQVQSVSSLAIMGLLPLHIFPKVSEDDRFLTEKKCGGFSEKNYRDTAKWKSNHMIFQEPMSSLQSILKCGFQVQEILMQHKKIVIWETKSETLSLFEKVKLPDLKSCSKSIP